MSTSTSRKAKSAKQPAADIAVPRDRNVDGSPGHRSDSPPSAADVNPRDEEVYTDREKPLVAGSRAARKLHDDPPRTKGTLDVGTAGDAARPIKPGIHGKPLAPRGDVGPARSR